MTEKPAKSGARVIEAFVKALPTLPGVYRMLSASGDVLYVGKAKNLQKRVHSYAKPQEQSIRIQRMVAQTAHMEFTTTHTEAEALLLEANLIKKLKPRYNILLRDDKSFPYILIAGDPPTLKLRRTCKQKSSVALAKEGHDFPLVTKHRGAKDRKGEYFGPFASGSAVNETLAVLHKAFMLRNCPDSVFAQRTRPCLQYQIKRCTAPCVAKVSREEYAKQVDMARQFLSGKSRKIQEYFAKEMQAASDRMDFESAAAFRDRIRALTSIQAHQTIHIDGLKDTDIHALHQKDGVSCVQVFFFRGGQNFGNRPYFPRHEKDETPGDILSAFILQFYASRPVPQEILVSAEIPGKTAVAEALRLQAGHKVTLALPTRGGKKELIQMALKNAKEALERKRAIDAGQSEILEQIAGRFGLEAPPERIEVYDNSHISGTHALGAMIVAGAEGFQKSSYRKFNMGGNIKAGDDVGMMREMLTRRFQPLLKADANAVWPDLLLIDGGQGQLNAALQVMADLGVSDIPLVAIAKGPDRNAGRERFFIPGKPPFSLEPNDPVLYFLQRIRDEAHRFAITSHRAKRSKAITSNPLDEVPEIGAKRKKALLLHFGSAKAVAESGLADLQKVAGISKAMAKKIYDFFHESGE